MVIECVPVRDASLGIVREEEKVTGGLGPAEGATDWRLLEEEDIFVEVWTRCRITVIRRGHRLPREIKRA
jgi:hypothetical protein